MFTVAGETVTLIDIGLFAIFLLVLTLPFKIKVVEKNLEAFLFIMGATAVTITSKWGIDLITLAAEEPVEKGIVPAVLFAGLIFFYGKATINKAIRGLTNSVPLPVFVAMVIFVLGMASRRYSSEQLRSGSLYLHSSCWEQVWRCSYSSISPRFLTISSSG
ncbi:DUF1646 family protein [Methanothrix sp.]|uniref:DUF1646 family protein n=1 Tax=Methanothrix sp. TaxID=90426 RepID=UPI00329A7F2D